MKVARTILVGLGIFYLALTADAAESENWAGFYLPSPSPVYTAIPAGTDICLRAILEAQERHNIPDNLLLAIGIQEAGRRVDGKLTVWPWTANSEGRGAFFDSKKALEDWVRLTQSTGKRSIDVGCMQVNQRWHAQHFASLEEATDPTANADYAARFLRNLYAETRDWWEAAGRYHSSTKAFKDIYLKKLAQNQRLANSSFAQSVNMKAQASTSRPSARQQPGIHWSSDMTGSGARVMRKVLSIYSATPLQPILPDYVEAR